MTTKPNRIVSVIPTTTLHIARVELIEEVIEELVGEKLARRACLGFRRIEKVLFFLNYADLPQIALSSAKIAANAGVTDRTIRRDLDSINALFDATGGLRLQHWDSGGRRLGEIEFKGEIVQTEEVVPNLFYWPSPGGVLVDTINNQINQFVQLGNAKRRDHQVEKELTRRLVRTAIANPEMQDILRDRQINKTVKSAKRADRKDDRLRAAQEGNVLPFPDTGVSQIEWRRGFVQALRREGLDKEQAHKIIDEYWD